MLIRYALTNGNGARNEITIDIEAWCLAPKKGSANADTAGPNLGLQSGKLVRFKQKRAVRL